MRLLAAITLAVVACSGGTAEPGTSAPQTTEKSTTTTTASATTSPLTGTGISCWTAEGTGGRGDLAFFDATYEMGLEDPLRGMHGHAAVWTDVDGDDIADLFVGTFADREDSVYRQRGASGPSPDRLLNGGASFSLVESFAETRSRSSGGVSADLDSDGDLDLVVIRNIEDTALGQTPTQVYENVDDELRPIADAGFPEQLGGRGVAVLDYDRDGLFDLIITEDRWAGGSSVLMHNDGGLSFSDATTRSGLPDDVHGLGVAVADFDHDGRHDIFVSGSNRLFYSDGEDGFNEQDSSVFDWEEFGPEDDVAGAAVADVNRDGWLDLAVGQHYNSTVEFGEMVSVRLYLNDGGTFTDVTERAGLTPLPTQAPHVELADFDNDGWPDLMTSAAAGDGPAIFMHQGLVDGVPRFGVPEGLGDAQYWVGAPTIDYDHDGRLDVFLLEWEPALPSRLLRNITDSGNWLELSVDPVMGHGLGWRVEILDGDDLIGARDITVTQGYSSGVLPIAHFGLGDLAVVDVRLRPPGGDSILIESVPSNQHIRWPDGC